MKQIERTIVSVAHIDNFLDKTVVRVVRVDSDVERNRRRNIATGEGARVVVRFEERDRENGMKKR
jgi:hypothetical protein